MEATHPKDIQRLNLGRAKLIKLAQEIFIKGSGNILLSSNFNVRNTKGTYTNLFIQCYLFYSDTPDKTVYFLKIHTDIDWCKKIKNGFHYYLGNDYSFFRYPDEEIFSLGNVFTSRELEIINLVRLSLSSEQIAEELFLSPYTINTHRANILKKSGHAKISELIIDLIEKGIL